MSSLQKHYNLNSHFCCFYCKLHRLRYLKFTVNYISYLLKHFHPIACLSLFTGEVLFGSKKELQLSNCRFTGVVWFRNYNLFHSYEMKPIHNAGRTPVNCCVIYCYHIAQNYFLNKFITSTPSHNSKVLLTTRKYYIFTVKQNI
jgi:hypothetical protein